MVDIEKLKPMIIEKLLPLKPDKIILFGSHAYGTPTQDSDIDIFLIKDSLTVEETRTFELNAMKRLRPLQLSFETNGFDILSAPTALINKREDYFYKVDILQNGKVWYEQKVS